jgi:hypothetical protein
MDFVLSGKICPERSTNTNPITRESFTNTVRGGYIGHGELKGERRLMAKSISHIQLET